LLDRRRGDDGIGVEEQDVVAAHRRHAEAPVHRRREPEVLPGVVVVGPGPLRHGAGVGGRGIVHDDHGVGAAQGVQAFLERTGVAVGDHDHPDGAHR
jgi:hypothetical protein